MSNISLVIEERATTIGNFIVGRILPFRQKRMVGPFIFIDHMGPVTLNSGEGLDVGSHPHIGLSTLTYLLEGCILHTDSIGTSIEIKPGAVNLMKAGKGIVHTERTPDYILPSEKRIHGLQIWIALPLSQEDAEPTFTHVDSASIPSWRDGNTNIKLILGEFGGRKSPVPMSSPSYLIEMTAELDTEIQIGDQLFGEIGMYIIEGEVELENTVFQSKQMLVSLNPSLCSFVLKKDSKIFLFGGEPLAEERFIHWNFVHSKKEMIEKAKKDWSERKFTMIEGDDSYVPLPGLKK